MKMRKALVATALFSLILGFFVVAPVNAQDFEDWLGQWVKGSFKDKGFIVDNSAAENKPEKNVDKISMYGYIQDWVEEEDTFTALVWQENVDPEVEGDWIGPIDYSITVLGENPNPLDYIGYGVIPAPGVVDGVELFALIVHVTAKWKGEGEEATLQNVKGRTVGGCVIYDLNPEDDPELPDAYFAANEALNFKGIPSDKVPDLPGKPEPEPL